MPGRRAISGHYLEVVKPNLPLSIQLALAEAEPPLTELIPFSRANTTAARWTVPAGCVRRLTLDGESEAGGRATPPGPAFAECVERRSEPQLLVVSERPGVVRLNGVPAPLLVVARDGDQVRFGDGLALQVRAVRRSPVGGAAELEVVGQICPVCLAAVETADTIYRCVCGKVYHWNNADSSRLQCGFTAGHCLGCEQEMQSGTAGGAACE